ncbi:hypothetical protein ECTPHS_05536 [Ectothiorhodospira sp. PHS-1]|uniref:PA3496 family putative envelope integrity protein n=1 Tax=Ectothiorhodospira sp. PHS-1 TaxID=519989 RepID=UPI00024A82E8|nr:hypothetical protein [Ectothiorhodospira sp. PHS-1]EHQ52131.1 hypothetical protein ECTPHS_05536 [Ectothiorhodospira sp. PHS-1]
MARAPDSLLADDEDDSVDWKESDSSARLSARRSLELLLERRALKRQLEDAFDENGSGLQDLDW